MAEILTDLEGNRYKTVIVGNQTWMAENLRVTKFSNGEVIGYIRDIDYIQNSLKWQNAQKPLQCLYGNDLNNLKYGRLYNWYCISSLNEICPKGWRIPSLSDWKILVEQSGGWNSSANEIRKAEGFNAILCGYRTGSFQGLDTSVYYWTSSLDPDQPELPPPGRTAKAISLSDNSLQVNVSDEYQIEGFCIRCIKI